MNKSRLFIILGVLLVSLSMVGVSLADNHISDATGSRGGIPDTTPPIVYVSPASFSEGFDDITILPGWYMQNNSNPIGVTNWFQGNDTVFPAHAGAPTAYIGANFNNTAGVGTISNWLLTPEQPLGDGATFTFWTRTATGSSWPDRLQVRLSLAGASTDVGTGAEDVGVFTTLLLAINPDLVVGGYPEVWTEYSVTLSGIPPGSTGRIGFRYYVTDGGPNGSNSNYIGIDTVEYIEPVLVPDIEVTPLSLHAEQPTNSLTQQNLQICNVGDGTLNWQIVEEPGMLAGMLSSGPATVEPAVTDPTLLGPAADTTQGEGAVPSVADPQQVGAGLEGSAGTSGFGNPDAVLWDNGPFVTHPGGGAGGADASALQTALGMGVYGFGHAVSANIRIADEFTISDPGGWYIDQFTFFAYQTLSGNTCTINHINYRIWDGPPDDPTSIVVYGDTTTNRFVNCAFSNVYRVLDTGLTNADRPIMVDVASAGVALPAGTYWLDWQTGGTLASGPWAPPITILGQTTTGNAMQEISGVWADLVDVGPQGLPFIIEGTVIDIPWLDETPKSGALTAGACTQVNVTFNSTGLALGAYTGALNVNSNDPDEPSVNVPVTLDVVAPPDISITPTSLESTQAPNTIKSQTLPICNVAGGSLNWNLWEGSGPIMDGISIPASAGNIDQGDEPVSVGLAPSANQGAPAPEHGFVLAGEPAYAVDIYLGKNVVHIPDTTNPGSWDVLVNRPDNQYFAGDFISGDYTTLYTIDNTLKELHAINTTTGAVMVIGPSLPIGSQTVTGMSWDPTTDTMYATATTGAVASLYTLDLTTGTPTFVADIVGAPYTIDIAFNGQGMLYGHEINLDVIMTINKTTGATTTIGPTGFSANFAQGMDFEETTGILYLSAYNSASSRGELRVVDTTTGATALIGPFPGGTEVDALAFATGSGFDIPWLSESPISGSVAAGSCQNVTVTFDSTGLPLGMYTGVLNVYSNDPDEPVITIPVTLNVGYHGFFLPIVQR